MGTIGGNRVILFGMKVASYFASIPFFVTIQKKNGRRKILQLISLIADSQLYSSNVPKYRTIPCKMFSEFLFHYIMSVVIYQLYLIIQMIEESKIREAFAVLKKHATGDFEDVASFNWFYETGSKLLKLGFLVFNHFEALRLQSIGSFFAFLLCKTLHSVVVALDYELMVHSSHHKHFNQNEVMY